VSGFNSEIIQNKFIKLKVSFENGGDNYSAEWRGLGSLSGKTICDISILTGGDCVQSGKDTAVIPYSTEISCYRFRFFYWDNSNIENRATALLSVNINGAGVTNSKCVRDDNEIYDSIGKSRTISIGRESLVLVNPQRNSYAKFTAESQKLYRIEIKKPIFTSSLFLKAYKKGADEEMLLIPNAFCSSSNQTGCSFSFKLPVRTVVYLKMSTTNRSDISSVGGGEGSTFLVVNNLSDEVESAKLLQMAERTNFSLSNGNVLVKFDAQTRERISLKIEDIIKSNTSYLYLSLYKQNQDFSLDYRKQFPCYSKSCTNFTYDVPIGGVFILKISMSSNYSDVLSYNEGEASFSLTASEQ